MFLRQYRFGRQKKKCYSVAMPDDKLSERVERLERDRKALARLVYKFLLQLVAYYERTYDFCPADV